MENLCRVCIENAAECTSLNSKIENSSNLTFFDFLNKCTSLNARESDKLPQSLCSTCTHSIKTFYSFVKLAEKSDIIFRQVLKNTIATERYNDNTEISCEGITIKNEMVEEESEDCNKQDSFHCQTSKNPTGSTFYILDIVKEEPRISESTSIVAKINESDEFQSNLDHPKGIIEEPDDFVSCIDRHLASIYAEHSDSEDDVPISILKRRLVKNEDETFQKTKIENSYKCKECDMVFNDKEEFRTHCRNHIWGGKQECNICGKMCAKRRYLGPHLEIHYAEKRYKCSICGRDFKHASNRHRHMLIHSGEKHFECEICSKKFRTKCNLECHMEIHNGITNKCGQCNKEFKYAHGLRWHMKWHINPKPFKCENCGKLFANKWNYNKHTEICKPVINFNEEANRKGHTESTCKECDIAFNDKREFEKHCRNHVHVVNRSKKNKYKCSICGKCFKQHAKFCKHMEIHCGGKPFECEICNNKFTTKSNLKLHMENHNGITTKKCNKCGKQLKNSESLRCHMKWHTNPKPLKCEKCGKSLSRTCNLARHMEMCIPISSSKEGTVTVEESSFTREETKKSQLM